MPGPQVRTPAGDAPLIPVMIFIAGGYLAWFGIHYFRSDTRWPTDPLKSVLTGKGLPAPTTTGAAADRAALVAAFPATTGAAPGAAGSPAGATASAVANDALKYRGAGYVFGGNADAVGNWDCSSFCSYVLGHDLHIPLPGGSWGSPGFPPATHGPTTLTYLLYGTAINRDQVAAGDLIVWNTHMGIAISPTQMISAQDEALGTGVAGFDGAIPGETAHYRRVPGVSPTPTGAAPPAPLGEA